MTSKLSFRARALDATKPLPIYVENEIPDTADCSLINRAVPQMPTGMEKEEEAEHHLQRAICTGTVIPTPEVFAIEDLVMHNKFYPEDYKMPRQLIYMQPFSMEADIPDYDMDSEDELWVNSQAAKLELTPNKFEEMMDRLEKGSGQTVVTLQEAKALIKEDDDLIIAVFDYWLNKRLKTQHPLIPQVRTEARFGVSNHNPYIAFRRRTEKMQTRKNRKNDESSYEKMLKLKRDLTRAVTLLEMVKRREKSKRELLHLTIEVFEKRYQAGDFSGQIVADALQQRPVRPAFTPLFQPNSMHWIKDDSFLALSRKEKRQYKKRRHKSSSKSHTNSALSNALLSYQGYHDGEFVSSEEEPAPASPSEAEEEEESVFAFKRRKNCEYHSPVESEDWFWCSKQEDGPSDTTVRLYPTFTSKVNGSGYRYLGHARRRVGRGGRVVLDRLSHHDSDRFWRSVGFNIYDSSGSRKEVPSTSANVDPSVVQSESNPDADSIVPIPSFSTSTATNPDKTMHFRPKTPDPQPEEPSSNDSGKEEVDSDLDDFYSKLEEDPYPSVSYEINETTVLGIKSFSDTPRMFDVDDLLTDIAINPSPSTAQTEEDTSPPTEDQDEWSSAWYLPDPSDSDFITDLGSDDPPELWDSYPTSSRAETFSETSIHRTPSCSFHVEAASLEEFNVIPDESAQLRSSNASMDADDNDSEVLLVDRSDNGVMTDRRNSMDKDDKENEIVSSISQVREVGEPPSLSANGDGSIDSSEDCVIIAEASRSSTVNSSRGLSSSSTASVLVDSASSASLTVNESLDSSSSAVSKAVEKNRTNSLVNNQRLGVNVNNFPGPSAAIMRKLSRKLVGSGNNGNKSLTDVPALVVKSTVNGDGSDGTRINPLELLTSHDFTPTIEGDSDSDSIGVGKSNLHLTVNSTSNSNNNSINMVSASVPSPSKISISNGPAGISIPECEQGRVVR